MLRLSAAAAILAVMAAPTSAQQPNSSSASLGVNAPAASVVGIGPTSANVWTDVPAAINIHGAPGTPVFVVYGAYSSSAARYGNFTIDLVNQGQNYADQILVDGFLSSAWATTDPITGNLHFAATLGACTYTGAGGPTCISTSSFVSAIQGLVFDPANAPSFVRSTGAAILNFTNNTTNFSMATLGFDQSVVYNFPTGFTFDFYGTGYTSCFVSANGFVSFGAADTGFGNPTIPSIRSGVGRIMSFYTDLEPPATPLSMQPRVFAHSYSDQGVTKVEIVHENLVEWGMYTGPHGGRITLSQNGDIDVYVPPFNTPSTLNNTVVGITPGNNVDTGVPPAAGETAFGRDLSADVLGGPVFLGINKAAFEFFDPTFNNVPQNPIDIIGLGFVPAAPERSGIHFIRDPSITAPGQARYIVQ